MVCALGMKCCEKVSRFCMRRCIGCELKPRGKCIDIGTIGTRERDFSACIASNKKLLVLVTATGYEHTC